MHGHLRDASDVVAHGQVGVDQVVGDGASGCQGNSDNSAAAALLVLSRGEAAHQDKDDCCHLQGDTQLRKGFLNKEF